MKTLTPQRQPADVMVFDFCLFLDVTVHQQLVFQAILASSVEFFTFFLCFCIFACLPLCVPLICFSSCLCVLVTQDLDFGLLLGPGFLHFILLLLQQLNWEINYETSLIHFLYALAKISCPNPSSIKWNCGLKSKKIFLLLLSENVILNCAK